MATKSPSLPKPVSQAATAVLQVAERLHAMDPEWVVFFREILGVDGVVRRAFPDSDSLVRFECSPQYARIREMLDSLRSRQQERLSDREPQRVVTVRMPRSLHESLKSCISKLMKLLDEEERRGLAGVRTDGGHAPAEPRVSRLPR
jgi:hypothetical protein